MASLEASDMATYSASVLDRATELCFLLSHDTIEPESLKQNPVNDFLSIISTPQSASTKPSSSRMPVFVNTSP